MSKLTKRFVESIRPGAKELVVWDRDLPGFGLRVLPSGRKTYVLQYRSRGLSRRLTMGMHGVLTPMEARAEAMRLLANIRQGADPAADRRAARGAANLVNLAARYLADHAEIRKKPRSVAEDQRMLEKFILPGLGKRKVAEITRSDVARLHNSLRRTPYQANRCLSVLRKAFDLAEDWGLRPEFSNPCRRVKRFPEPGRVRFLSEIELARLGEALREAEEAASVPPECISAFRLYILTGCRHDEIRLLKWAYVDLGRGVLNLPDSKTGPRTVHLNAPAVKVLKSIERRSEWVIPSPIDSSKPYGHLHRSWRVIRRSAGLEDLRIHDLRHSFASIGAAQGQSLLVIGSLLGHKQITTTQKYAHLADDPVRAANERIGSLIAATMNGTEGEVIQLRR